MDLLRVVAGLCGGRRRREFIQTCAKRRAGASPYNLSAFADAGSAGTAARHPRCTYTTHSCSHAVAGCSGRARGILGSADSVRRPCLGVHDERTENVFR
jgi:hypothetical protein